MKIKNILVVYTNPKNLAEKETLHVVEKTFKKYNIYHTVSEREKLSKRFNNDAAKLREEFFKTVQNKNTNQTIAILRILAQNKELENFLKDDAKLNKFLSAVWEKQFGKDFVSQFQKQPDQIKFVKQFLRYVLEERLGMTASDAARVGLQIGNIFVSSGKKGYNKMAYFDVASKGFKWLE